jgi:hypothetical protein
MNWKEILEKARKEDIDTQTGHKAEIVEAFREFWHTHPIEQDFAKLISGLVLFPEIAYIMACDWS